MFECAKGLLLEATESWARLARDVAQAQGRYDRRDAHPGDEIGDPPGRGRSGRAKDQTPWLKGKYGSRCQMSGVRRELI